MQVLHGTATDMSDVLSTLESVLEKRRRGAHPVELNGYFSTLSFGMRRQPREAVTHEELVRLPDGGTVRLVWRRALSPGRMRSTLGVVLILPGLNNSSRWPAVQQSAEAFCARGYDTAVLDYRGVGGLELTSAKIGCSDAWRDLPAVLRVVVAAAHPHAPVFGVGFSMGGSILLKHLAAEPSTPIRAAVTVSAPLRFAEHMRRLETGVDWRLVNLATVSTKKAELLAKYGPHYASGKGAELEHLEKVDWRKLACATSLRELEAASVCKLHGYADPEDYYAACTPQPEAVRVPWLCVHARDDPVINVEPVLAVAQAVCALNAPALFVVTPRGGHLGYAGGLATSWQDEPSWADELAATFIHHWRRSDSGRKPPPPLSRL